MALAKMKTGAPKSHRGAISRMVSRSNTIYDESKSLTELQNPRRENNRPRHFTPRVGEAVNCKTFDLDMLDSFAVLGLFSCPRSRVIIITWMCSCRNGQ